jgi:hypothetical protein
MGGKSRHANAWQGEAAQAPLVEALTGVAGTAGQGKERQCRQAGIAWQGMARSGNAMQARLRIAWRGEARPRTAGTAGLGIAGRGAATQARRGNAWQGAAMSGGAEQARLRMVRRGLVSSGVAGGDRRDTRGRVWCGKDGRQRKARHGMAEPSAAGMARRGGAEHGATRPGNAGMA